MMNVNDIHNFFVKTKLKKYNPFDMQIYIMLHILGVICKYEYICKIYMQNMPYQRLILGFRQEYDRQCLPSLDWTMTDSACVNKTRL